MSLSAKQHHHPPVGGEYDPFAPPRISIPPYSTGIWDTDVDLVDVRHLVSEAYRQQWDKGNHNDGLCWFMAVYDCSFMSVYDGCGRRLIWLLMMFVACCYICWQLISLSKIRCVRLISYHIILS